MNKVKVKTLPLSFGFKEDDVVLCTVTGNTYVYTNNTFQLIKKEDLTDSIPQWLKEDVKNLALEEVRLSCAIYELYDHYANTSTINMNVDETSKYLTMVNERLDWIDRNVDIIEYTINNLWKLESNIK